MRNVANVLLLFEKEWCRMGVDMRGMMWEKINRRAGAKSARSAVSMTCRGGGAFSRLASRTHFLKSQEKVGLLKSTRVWKTCGYGLAVFVVAFATAFLAASMFVPTKDTNADTNTTDNSSASGYSLTLSATSAVNLDIQVSPVDTMTVASGSVNVKTTSPGYKLYIGMTSDSTGLLGTINGISSSIDAISGTIVAPTALTRSTWGYAIPSATPNLVSNNFSASYSTMTSATPDMTQKFAYAPASSSKPDLIATATAATASAGDTYPVYYGIRANEATASGSYSNSVMFTAVADAGAAEAMTLTPNTIGPNTATTVTVATTMYSTSSSATLDIYFLTAAQKSQVDGGAPVENIATALSCTKTSGAPITYSCALPAQSTEATYYFYAKSSTYGKKYSAAFTVENTGPSSFFELTTMQELADYPELCTAATTPVASATKEDTTGAYAGNTAYVPTVKLVDDRTDGTAKTKYSYTVKKLADGNCWMTENLKLTNVTISNADSNLPSGKTVTIPASSTANWCTTNSTACDNQLMTLDATDTSISGQSSAQPSYGVYYNWYTATATYGTYETASGNVSYDICPKGWKLPTGGSSGEFQSLYSKYNTSDLMTKATGGPAFVLSGYRDGSSTRNQGSDGNYWSSTANNSSSAYRLGLYSSNVSPARSGYKYYGFSVRCVAKDFWNITTMQDMTPEIASTITTTPSASATAEVTTKADYEALTDKSTAVPTRTLTDTRDGKTYTVKKLADGNIWMTENLKLINVTISNADSNLPSGKTVKIPASSTANWCTTDSAACDNKLMTLNSGNANYGVYYNWYTATATYGTYEMTSGNVSYDICPKGWRLPTGGNSGEFQSLYSKYNTSALMRKATGGPAFVLSGSRYGSSTYDQGSYGYYWSSTANNNNYAYYLDMDSSNVYPADLNGKYVGFGVRCVAE